MELENSAQKSASPEELIPWLRLKQIPGIGNLLAKRLVEAFGSPQKAMGASRQALAQIPGISLKMADRIRRPGGDSAAARRELESARKQGYCILPLSDPSYPPLLREIPDPPPVLYVYGYLGAVQRPLAVVGARSASRYGRGITAQLASELATQGFSIVSGMARGIDTAAHQAALAAGGTTVAVLGSGLCCLYPPENRDLFHHIAQQGAVVSEFALETRPEPRNFPIRNRIISGMSLGTVVVEAAQRSGSLITARLAAEQNREVFAVPGSVRSRLSRGCHGLIQQGAKLVTQTADIVEEFSHLLSGPAGPLPAARGHAAPQPGRGSLSPEEQQVWAALGPYPIHIDELARDTALAQGRLAEVLLQLELRGLIIQGAGKMFYKEDHP